MPQIVIEYDVEQIDEEQLNRLAETLAPLCAKLFSVSVWDIQSSEFGFKFEQIMPPSRSTHNVIVRIALHNFKNRLAHAPEHAAHIKESVLRILASYGHLDDTTVGVALSYLPIEWSEGKVNDIEL